MIAKRALLIAAVVNSSLDQGIFRSRLKETILRPLLKKINLDHIKKNYKPVLNVAFLGKLIEKFASKQIINHITRNNLMKEMQSAYMKNDSTKKAVLKVKSGILKSMDSQEVTCLILLDLSAVFDTVYHNLLIQHLNTNFGIRNKALD